MNSERTREAVRHTAQADAGTAVTSYLLAGPLAFGGIGYALDTWLGTRGIVAVGVLAGLGLALYVVWLRYGGGQGTHTGEPQRQEPASSSAAERSTSAPAPRSTIEETP